ncbi:unnamed protein product [Adineta ricciae]|uniref:Uncharacterized protein n=1 Tax=Adineta ricciae TaxID=249248 RepID=A0A816D9G9_ADIRI|nr:unnamed protein product [Adineta ricciae]CAF1631305.1 unnamed protein product [Adineta ricciae]
MASPIRSRSSSASSSASFVSAASGMWEDVSDISIMHSTAERPSASQMEMSKKRKWVRARSVKKVDDIVDLIGENLFE